MTPPPITTTSALPGSNRYSFNPPGVQTGPGKIIRCPPIFRQLIFCHCQTSRHPKAGCPGWIIAGKCFTPGARSRFLSASIDKAAGSGSSASENSFYPEGKKLLFRSGRFKTANCVSAPAAARHIEASISWNHYPSG